MIMSMVLGCTDDFEEMNVDPNNPSETSTAFLLTNAQKAMADELWDVWFNGRQGMQYAQYWASNQYTDESRYQERVSINQNAWTTFYTIVLNDLEEIIELNTAEPETYDVYGDPDNQIAVARILQVYLFQIMTDSWGPIPYVTALNPDETISPEYDAQEDVYMMMLEDLTEAINRIEVSEPGFVSGDIIYGGDMNKWKKFGNSLKLRIAIRISDVAPGVAGPAIQEAVNSGVFESNEDNALFYYLASVPNNNPLNEDRKTRADFAVSEALVTTLLEKDDPRIAAFAEPAANSGEYVGMPYGLPQAEAGNISPDDVSQPSGADDLSSGILAATAPTILMTYAEVQFTLAEAAARGLGGVSNAEAHYDEAIRGSLNFWGVTSTSTINSYIAQNSYDPSDFRQSIGVQKWIDLYGQGIQGWIEFRRLDFEGVLIPSPDPLVDLNTPAGVPVRTLYSVDEQQLNRANYLEAIKMIGGAGASASGQDDLGTRVWWDVN